MKFDPLPSILKDNNYSVPKTIRPYLSKNLQIKEKILKLQDRSGYFYFLRIRNDININVWEQYMAYSYHHKEALELYSHYDLSYGDVITTGLGFAVREQWIAGKPEVKKITVIEKNKDLIDYHKRYSNLNNKIELIHADANKYVGQCDVLLLDHYEGSVHEFYKQSININNILNNISCNIFWAWQLENVTKSYSQYNILKNMWNKLPNISEEKYKFYLNVYNSEG